MYYIHCILIEVVNVAVQGKDQFRYCIFVLTHRLMHSNNFIRTTFVRAACKSVLISQNYNCISRAAMDSLPITSFILFLCWLMQHYNLLWPKKVILLLHSQNVSTFLAGTLIILSQWFFWGWCHSLSARELAKYCNQSLGSLFFKMGFLVQLFSRIKYNWSIWICRFAENYGGELM